MYSPQPQQSRFDILSCLRTPRTLRTPRLCRGHFFFFVSNPYNMGVYGLPRTPVIKIWHLCMDAFITIPWGAGASRGGPEGRFCESLIKVNVVDIFNRGLNLGPRVQRSRSEKKWGPWLGDLMWSLLWLNLLVNLVQLRRSSWLSDNDKTIKMFHQIRVTKF